VNNAGAFGRDLQLAQFDGAVVRLGQKLEMSVICGLLSALALVRGRSL
jgi:hypothetical protein